MTPLTTARLQIHFCVLLWGFTAILGKLISLGAAPLVWWRMLIVTVALALVPRVWRALKALSLRLIAAYCGIGVLVTLHWLTFYGAVKLANASVAATCMALATALVAIVEPLAVTALELGAGVVALTVLAPLLGLVFPGFDESPFVVPDARDLLLLLTLALACTLLPFALSLVALRHISAFTAQLAVNLEPVYAILLAIPLLGEQRELDAMFYVGVAIVLAAVLAHPLLERPRRVEHAETLATAEAKQFTD